MYSLIKELATTPCWRISPVVGHQLAEQLTFNIANRVPVSAAVDGTNRAAGNTQLLVCRASARRQFLKDNAARLTGDNMLAQRADLFQGQILVGDVREMMRCGDVDADDEVINLVNIEGPITRDGGACSYGSKEVRDEVMYVAEQSQCLGHVFRINSPGGSSYSANDYEMAIEAAKAANQPTLGLIDGACDSAAFHLAAMLDEVYYVHPNCTIGCIGTYGAYYTNKNGDKNSVTQQVFHEVYATISTDKNGMFRKSAEGDDSEIEKYVTEDAQKFVEDVKRMRPNTPEEWLKGKVLLCSETDGIWTNGRSSLDGCIQRILELTSHR